MAVKITHRIIGQQLRFPNQATANAYLKVIGCDAANWELTPIRGEARRTLTIDQRGTPTI